MVLVVALPPGRYHVVITHDPFAPTMRDIELTLNQTLDVSTTLRLAAHDERVEVAATVRPLIDPSQTEIGRTITTSELDGLPVSVGQFRDFTGLATLTPGVAPDVTSAGGGLATAGQLSSNNTFLIDGLAGTPGNVPLDAIQEFRVASNQFGAAYGQASGAIVDVLTRSGSNTAGGRLSWFQQDGAWNATSPLAKAVDAADPGFTQSDLSGYWGGPIRPNRAFLLGVVRETVRHTQFIDAAAAAPAFRPGAPLTTPVDWNLPEAFVKADVRLSSANTFTARYNYSLVTGDDAAREVSSTNERRRSLTEPDQNLAFMDVQILGVSALNEIRLQGNHMRFAWSVNDYCPGCLTLNYRDILLGKPANAPSDTRTDTVEAADTLTWVTAGWSGQHDLKVGLDATYLAQSGFTVNTTGTYLFTNDLPFDSSNPATYPVLFTKNIDGGDHRESQAIASFFVDDTWRPRAGMTVSLGVRWDRTRFPGPSTTQNDVAPRIAVAVDPWHTGRSVFRAGFGRYYDGRDLQTALDADTGREEFIQNPGFQGDLLAFDPLGFNPNRAGRPTVEQFSVFEPVATATPYTDQATVGLERQFGLTTGLTVDLIRARGHQLPIEMDLNYPDPVTHLSPDPSVKQILATETIAESWYTGLQMGLTTRPIRGQTYSVAYTLSSSQNDTDGPKSLPSAGSDILVDRGPTLDDARHRVTASGTVPLSGGWIVQAIVNAWSPLPYNITTGADNNGDGVFNDRPAGDGRNSGRGAAFFQADVRLSRVFRAHRNPLELLVEVFNVTNRANWMAYNAYGQPQSAGPPRQVQLGVRWSY